MCVSVSVCLPACVCGVYVLGGGGQGLMSVLYSRPSPPHTPKLHYVSVEVTVKGLSHRGVVTPFRCRGEESCSS